MSKHPITPPPELVQQWWATETYGPYGPDLLILATKAARWGADQELEACMEWMRSHFHGVPQWADELRAARRHGAAEDQAQQALTRLDSLHADLRAHGLGANTDIIRRALERLQELENRQ